MFSDLYKKSRECSLVAWQALYNIGFCLVVRITQRPMVSMHPIPGKSFLPQAWEVRSARFLFVVGLFVRNNVLVSVIAIGQGARPRGRI